MLYLVRDLRPVLGIEFQFLLQDAFEDLLVVFSLKWRVPAQHDEEDDAEAPDIAGEVVVTLEYLRRHVVGGADYGMHLLTGVLLLNLPEALRKSEIYQLNLGLVRLVRKQEVLRLQISVTDPMLMEMLDCGEDLAH